MAVVAAPTTTIPAMPAARSFFCRSCAAWAVGRCRVRAWPSTSSSSKRRTCTLASKE
jgi:hypothetical protein